MSDPKDNMLVKLQMQANTIERVLIEYTSLTQDKARTLAVVILSRLDLL